MQARLFLNPADDPYEREANAVADHVMRLPSSEQTAVGGIGHVQRRVQRLCAQCAKALEEDDEGHLCPECAAKVGGEERNKYVSRKEADTGISSNSRHVPSVVSDTLRTGGELLNQDAQIWRVASGTILAVSAFMRTPMPPNLRAPSMPWHTPWANRSSLEQVATHRRATAGGGCSHEPTHTIQQRGDAVTPMRADGLAIQRDEDKKEDFDTEQRRLIRDAKTVGDVKDINAQAFHLASDDDRYRLIGILLNQGWVGPRDEYYLEHIWGSFGKNLPDAARKGLVLWNQCVERGADLWDLAELGPMKDNFKADVAAKTRGYLVKNREFVQKEQKTLGLDKAQTPPTVDQYKALADLKEAGSKLRWRSRSRRRSNSSRSGTTPSRTSVTTPPTCAQKKSAGR